MKKLALFLSIYCLPYLLTAQSISIDSIAEQLAQEQLDAYNNHDLEAFLKPYADDVKVYQFPNKLQFEGKETMRKNYNFLITTPDLHCELVNRIVEGNTVIDHENVTVSKDRPPFKAIAIYKIKDGKIAQVYFIQ
ncbi:MAG: nuclear transport factor 2 family protein [Bacteroidota bacterium]